MSTTKLNIGKIPISKGEYQKGTTYQRLNQVTMLGSTYQSKIDNNTSAPAQMGADGAVENINTDKWLCVAVGNVSAAKKVVYNNKTSRLDAGNVQEAIDEVENNKLDKQNVAQEFGSSADKVVSQKALNNVFNIIKWDDARSESERLTRAFILDVYLPKIDASKGESIAISGLTYNKPNYIGDKLTVDFRYRNTSSWGEKCASAVVNSSTNERIAIAVDESGAYVAIDTELFKSVVTKGGNGNARQQAIDINFAKNEHEGIIKNYLKQRGKGDAFSNLNILCIGDSLTHGDYGSEQAGTPNNHTENYPYFLKRYLGCNVINKGSNGLSASNWWSKIAKTIDYTQFDIAIIMLGTDSAIPNNLSEDVEPFDNYEDYKNDDGAMCKIIEYIYSQNNNISILLCTPPYARETRQRDYHLNALNSNESVKAIGKRYSIPVKDLFYSGNFNRFNNSTMQPIDGLHFGIKGYQKLATVIGNFIKSCSSFILDKSLEEPTNK